MHSFQVSNTLLDTLPICTNQRLTHIALMVQHGEPLMHTGKQKPLTPCAHIVRLTDWTYLIQLSRVEQALGQPNPLPLPGSFRRSSVAKPDSYFSAPVYRPFRNYFVTPRYHYSFRHTFFGASQRSPKPKHHQKTPNNLATP